MNDELNEIDERGRPEREIDHGAGTASATTAAQATGTRR